MVTDATKKYRDYLAIGLLGVAGLWFIGALSLLFKSTDFGFSDKAALTGGQFTAPVPVLSLVVAVLLVTRFGDELSQYSRIVVLTALAIAGLDLLFGVITYLAQFGADQGFGFVGVPFAGKVVGAVIGLAEILFLAIALGYVFTAFQGLPAPVARQSNQWGGDRGYAQYGQGAPYGPGGQQSQGPQQGWAPQDQGYAPGGQPGWGHQPASPYGWVTPDQPQTPGWAGQPGSQGGQAQTWAPQPTPAPGGWDQPAQQGWGSGGYGASPAQPAQPGPWQPAEPTAQASQWGAQSSSGYGATAAPDWTEPETTVVPATDPAAPAPEDPYAPPAQPDHESLVEGADPTYPAADSDADEAADEAGDEAAVADSRDDVPTPAQDDPPSDQGWWQRPQQ